MDNFYTVLAALTVKHTEEMLFRKLFHFKIISDNIQSLPENLISVLAVGLLCKGIVMLLIRPVIEIGEQSPIVMLHRKHQHYIRRKHGQEGDSLHPVSSLGFPVNQNTVHPG